MTVVDGIGSARESVLSTRLAAGQRPDTLSPEEIDRLLRPAPRRKPWRSLLRPYVLTFDVAAVTFGWLLVGRLDPLAWASAVMATLTVLHLLGLYRSRLELSSLADLPGCAVGAAAGAVAFDLVASLGGPVDPARAGLLALVSAVLLVTARAAAYGIVRLLRARGLVQHRALIVGSGDASASLAEAMKDHPEYGLLPVGMLSLSAEPRTLDGSVPVVGHLGDLSRIVRRDGITEVIFALPDQTVTSEAFARDAQLRFALAESHALDCTVFYVPRDPESVTGVRGSDTLWGIPLVRMPHVRQWSTARWVKRALDAAAASVMLLIAAPILLPAMIAVRLENGPGIIFRQQRIGLDGQPFDILKLQTIRPELVSGGPRFSVNGDPDIRPVSRFLRATSIDELPQLFNVLRGDMSLVGPRPERPVFVEQFSSSVPGYSARHRAPVGMTGWAQVNGLRGDTSIAERARFDNFYINNWSLWFDITILIRTATVVLLRRGS